SCHSLPSKPVIEANGRYVFLKGMSPADIHSVLLRVPVSEGAPSERGRQRRAVLLGGAAGQESDGPTFRYSCEEVDTVQTRGRDRTVHCDVSSPSPWTPTLSPR